MMKQPEASSCDDIQLKNITYILYRSKDYAECHVFINIFTKMSNSKLCRKMNA